MISAIAHRGPDAQGSHFGDGIALGAVRLAIIDLLSGDQPIYSEDRSICLVYNGEVYNYRELRQSLRARGHRLASETDSEVIVHLYEDHGIDLVPRLNGMFAFALWDSRRRRLYLVRDRFGIKPLYYRWDGTMLSFASEAKALLAGGRSSAALDHDALVELLTFQNIVSDKSLFQGISLLPAGCILRLDEQGLKIDQYWDALPHPQSVVNSGDLTETVREKFSRGVERQLVSDVELASYLSGGLDTGAVTAIAARHLERLTTFSTGFDTSGADGMEAGFDERGDAAELAELLGTHHHEMLLDSDDMEMTLGRLMFHLEEPRMSFSYPNYLTAGFASLWVKVVLSGVGGDEIFGGYPWRYSLAEQPGFPGPYFDYWSRLMSRADLAKALSPQILATIDLDRPRALFDDIMGRTTGLPTLDRILYYEFKTFLHGLLVLEDKLSMAHSLESRVPFLDNDLVDFMLTVPAEIKLSGARSKDLFRQAMEVVLPSAVVTRAKTGFTPPQAHWFRGPQDPYVRRVLLSDRALERGVFRPDFVRGLLDAHHDERSDHRLIIWTLLCLEQWHRIFIDREHPK